MVATGLAAVHTEILPQETPGGGGGLSTSQLDRGGAAGGGVKT